MSLGGLVDVLESGQSMVAEDERGSEILLTEFTDAGLEHLVLAGQHLRLGLVESALVAGWAEQEIFALMLVW